MGLGHPLVASRAGITFRRLRLNIALVPGSENHPFMGLHKARRAAYPKGAAVGPMGIGHRGADVLASLQQMGGKGMAEGMAAGGFGDPCCCHSLLHGPLHQGGIDGMAPLKATAGIPPAILLGEHPLPAPVAIGWGVFPRQGLRHQHLSPTGCQVRPML